MGLFHVHFYYLRSTAAPNEIEESASQPASANKCSAARNELTSRLSENEFHAHLLRFVPFPSRSQIAEFPSFDARSHFDYYSRHVLGVPTGVPETRVQVKINSHKFMMSARARSLSLPMASHQIISWRRTCGVGCCKCLPPHSSAILDANVYLINAKR